MNLFSIATISYLIFNGFNTYVELRFFNVFLENKRKKIYLEVAAGILYFILNSILYLLFHNPFINLVSSIIGLFLVSFIYDSKFLVRLIAVFIIYVLGMIWEIIPYAILTGWNIDNVSLSKGISSIGLFATVLFVERMYQLKSDYRLKLIHGISILSISAGSIMIMILAYMAAYNEIITLAIVSILLYMNIMIFYLYDMVNKYYANVAKVKLLEKQNFAYDNQLSIIQNTGEEIKTFKHDIKNHMISLSSLLEKENYCEGMSYINHIFDIIHRETTIDTGNIALDSLLNYKIIEARKKQIDINVSVHIPEELQISSFHWSIILGNLLDNAIEAVQDCRNKKIDLELELDRGVLYLTLCNPYLHELRQENGRFLSQKTDHEHHGIGLYSIEQALKSYDGKMDIHTEKDNFIVEIILYNVSNK